MRQKHSGKRNSGEVVLYDTNTAVKTRRWPKLSDYSIAKLTICDMKRFRFNEKIPKVVSHFFWEQILMTFDYVNEIFLSFYDNDG